MTLTKRLKGMGVLAPLVGMMIALGGCAGKSKQTSSDTIAATGPTVLNARVEPGTIELNKNMLPTERASVVADVKDFQSPINDVKLRFMHVPLEVPMVNVGGTTWVANLTPQQLQMLAVSGQTMKYEANILARNMAGQTGLTSQPVEVAVKAPDLAAG